MARLGVLLDVLVTTAQRVPTLLVLDEFSSIATVTGAAGTMQLADDARGRLVADGDVIDDGGRLTVTEPVFADWIRTTLPL